MTRDLGMEVTRLVGEIHPTAFTGDPRALARATAEVADVLGGLLALARQQAPHEAAFKAAARMMFERSLRAAESFQTAADGLRAHAAPAYSDTPDRTPTRPDAEARGAP